MGKEIIISTEKELTRIAIIEEGELAELYIENPENERTLGDVFLGKIRKIMPSIQAAFVDIGQKQDAFLHFSDLSDNLPEMLSFAAEDNPEVGKLMPPPAEEHARPLARRRNAQSAHRDHRDEAAPGAGTEAAAETSAPEGATPDEQPASRGGGRRRGGYRRHPQRRTAQRSDDVAETDDDEPIKERLVAPETFLKRDQRILVKIVKEPISTKGSRVSTDISLAGRFLVLVPMADYVAVSKKIVSYKERRRLRALAKSLVPDGFGVIVRTVAEGKNAKALDTDLRLLVEKWRKIEAKLAGRPDPPLLVHEDVNMASSVIRDLFSDDYDRILIDDPRLYRNIKNYVSAVAPHMAPVVQLHKGKGNAFEATGIARDVAKVFESRVDLPGGGYLFIERTEAMYVVDVNSGRSGRGMTQEENSLRVNLEAARVIAKQIRLRDIGGIIVIDFIDLRHEHNRQKVYDELKKEFRKDRAVTKLLPMSDFGLVQITRQRLRPSVTTWAGPAGTANGTAAETAAAARAERQERPAPVERENRQRPAPAPRPPRPEPVPSPDDLVRQMEEWVAATRDHTKRRAVTLKVHPFTAAYLNRKVPTLPTRWFLKYLVRVRVEIEEALTPYTYRFLDARTGEDVTALPVPTMQEEKRES